MNSVEIKVNIAELNDCITRMRALEQTLAARQLNPDYGTARGEVVDSVQDCAAAFLEAGAGLRELVRRTAERLEAARDDMVKTDENLAGTMTSR